MTGCGKGRQAVIAAMLGVAALASGCKSGGAADTDPNQSGASSNSSAQQPQRILGTFMKGPVRGADVTLKEVNADESLSDPPSGPAQTTTDASGRFNLLAIGGYPESDYYRVTTVGGSYVDESDPVEFPATTARSVDLTGQLIDFLVPASPAQSNCDGGCDVTAVLTPFTAALTDAAFARRQASAQQCRDYELHEAENKRFVDNSGVFIDPVQVVPENPINPSGLNDPENLYALLLGGFASASNVAAIQLGLTQPTVSVLADMVTDLADGILDGRALDCSAPGPACTTQQIQGNYAGQGPQNLPSIDLNAEIRRFRNNHADQYANVSLPQLSTSLATAKLPPVAGSQFYAVPSSGGTLNIAAASGLKSLSCNPERADVLAPETTVELVSDFMPPALLGTGCADGVDADGVSSGFELYADGSFCVKDGGTCSVLDGCQGEFRYKLVDSDNGTESYEQTVYIGLPFSGGGSVCTPPPSGMVSWYSGDNHADDIEGTNHGSLVGNATYAVGFVDQAFSFDGSGDFVQVPDSPDFTLGSGDFTIDLWVNFNSFSTGAVYALVGHDDGPGSQNKWIFWVSGGDLQFHINNTSAAAEFLASAPFAPTPGNWRHVAVTRSGNTFTTYIDGAFANSNNSSAVIADASAPFTIGWAEGSMYVPGLIDEVEIFDRALTPGEIQAIFNAGSAGKCKPTCDLTTDHTDLWEYTNHSITTSSGALGCCGGAEVKDAFGKVTAGTAEPSNFMFQDFLSDGTVHTIEWVTTTPVLVDDFKLLAHMSGTTPPFSDSRSFREFRLYGCSSTDCSYELLYSSPIVLPYGAGPSGDRLARCVNIPPFTGDKFKAEFVQQNSGSNTGPRVVELDGFGFSTLDSDGDGLTDDEENGIYGTDPFNSDTDGDDLEDGYEVFAWNSDPLDQDTDGDDVSDGFEDYYGSDPTVGDTVFHLRPTGNDATGNGLTWATAWQTNSKLGLVLPGQPASGFYYVLYQGDGAIHNYQALNISGPSNSTFILIGGISDPDGGDVIPSNFAGSKFDGGGNCASPTGTGARPLELSDASANELAVHNLWLKNGDVTGNGGGLRLASGSSFHRLFTLTDSKISNSCVSGNGGGLYVGDFWDPEIDNVIIAGNEASGVGGGAYFGNGGTIMEIAQIDGNIAANAGGGIYSSEYLDITDSQFRQNGVISSPGGGCGGGAIYQSAGDLYISDSLFSSNQLSCNSPSTSSAGGGAIFSSSGSFVSLFNSRFLSNSAYVSLQPGAGGAVSIINTDSELTNNLFVGNIAQTRGGAISFQGAGTFHHLQLNTVVYNQALDTGADRGGGLYNDASSIASYDNIVFFNDNGNVSTGHDTGEDLVNANSGGYDSVHDTIDRATGLTSQVSRLTTFPNFERGFYQNGGNASIDSGSEPDSDVFFCNLVFCDPDHSFSTNTTGVRDGHPALGVNSAIVDRGFHYEQAADSIPTNAVAAPGQNNSVAPNCGLSYGFSLTSAGPSLGAGHRVAVCIVSSPQATQFNLGGQGTLEPIFLNGDIPAGCSERAVMASDSGINGVYSISIDATTGGFAGPGPHNIGLQFFVDDSPSFAHTVTGVTLGLSCGDVS